MALPRAPALPTDPAVILDAGSASGLISAAAKPVIAASSIYLRQV